jgi:hypothetical protein
MPKWLTFRLEFIEVHKMLYDYIRQEMKQLVDEGKLERLFNGVYYLSYTTILGTKGKMSVDRYVDLRSL